MNVESPVKHLTHGLSMQHACQHKTFIHYGHVLTKKPVAKYEYP